MMQRIEDNEDDIDFYEDIADSNDMLKIIE